MPRKIAIVGKAATSVLAPWRDPDWEIWGMPWILFPRATRLFEIHSQACLDEQKVPLYRDSLWLDKALEHYADVPVWCHPTRTHLFPNGRDYPFDEVLDWCPVPYLENTIAYEIALALYEGVDEIGLYGVHMMGRSEFVWERASVIYLIGLAQGMGVNIHLPPGSPLFMSGFMAGRYGLPGGYRSEAVITGNHTFSDKEPKHAD